MTKCLAVLFLFFFAPSVALAAPSISGITQSSGPVGKFSKFESTFSVSTVATNLQMPYDPSPPAGITINGVSVDGVFTSPAGKTYSVPAFYYYGYQYEVKTVNGETFDWPLANGQNSWKVRFAPDEIGTWQYYLKVKDSSGAFTGPTKTFDVIESGSHGFVKVSKNDSRYFEFSDGTLFPGQGLNLNYEQVDTRDFVQGNKTLFDKVSANGVQLLRLWLTSWNIWGSSWNPWFSVRGDYDGYIPRPGLIVNGAASTPETPSSMMVLEYSEESGKNTAWFDACRASFPFQPLPAVERNSQYQVTVRYQAKGISGPRNSSYPNYGFVLKVQNPNDGNWHTNCFEPGDPTNGKVISGYAHDTAGWTKSGVTWSSPVWETLTGTWQSGDNDYFFPILYLAIENANNMSDYIGSAPYGWHPYVHIDKVLIQKKDPATGSLGQNIALKPSMEHLNYFLDRNAFAFENYLDKAAEKGIYFRVVIMEKNEQIQNEIDYSGNKTSWSGGDNNNFFGNYRSVTAIRWLQQGYWRYLQARFGYSPAIMGFEATNEAAPGYTNHYGQVDEMGKYFHCRVFGVDVASGDSQKCNFSHPNSHLVSTSYTAGWEGDLWNDPKYPNVDYADIHQYIPKDANPTGFYDTATASAGLSLSLRSNKPILRGEVGLTDFGSNTDSYTTDINSDASGFWLHNFIWSQLNSGGLIESYWYVVNHIYPGYTGLADGLLPLYRHYYDFIKDVPLNNGKFADAGGTASDPNVRVTGMKDNSGHAIIWVNNKNNRWNQKTGRLAGTVSISGFSPNTNYPLVVHNFDQNTTRVVSSSTVSSDISGKITITLNSAMIDAGLKIGNYTTVTVKTGDLNADGAVNISDLRIALVNFGTIFNLSAVISNYGK